MRVRVLIFVSCLALFGVVSCKAEQKQDPPPQTETAVEQSDVQPSSEDPAKSQPARGPELEQEHPARVEDHKAQIELMEETCAKLETEPMRVCDLYVTRLKAGDPQAIEDLEVVTAGIRVQGNMVFLSEDTVTLLTQRSEESSR